MPWMEPLDGFYEKNFIISMHRFEKNAYSTKYVMRNVLSIVFTQYKTCTKINIEIKLASFLIAKKIYNHNDFIIKPKLIKLRLTFMFGLGEYKKSISLSAGVSMTKIYSSIFWT